MVVISFNYWVSVFWNKFKFSIPKSSNSDNFSHVQNLSWKLININWFVKGLKMISFCFFDLKLSFLLYSTLKWNYLLIICSYWSIPPAIMKNMTISLQTNEPHVCEPFDFNNWIRWHSKYVERLQRNLFFIIFFFFFV